uniref:Uncharacterized protein n=1 Tax=Craspedostauros australis TaxID=1486917 RepID=A0A7R9ZKQ8_9STRA
MFMQKHATTSGEHLHTRRHPVTNQIQIHLLRAPPPVSVSASTSRSTSQHGTIPVRNFRDDDPKQFAARRSLHRLLLLQRWQRIVRVAGPLGIVVVAHHAHCIAADDIQSKIDQFHFGLVAIYPFLGVLEDEVLNLVVSLQHTQDDTPVTCDDA